MNKVNNSLIKTVVCAHNFYKVSFIMQIVSVRKLLFLGARLHVWENTADTDQNFHPLGVYAF